MPGRCESVWREDSAQRRMIAQRREDAKEFGWRRKSAVGGEQFGDLDGVGGGAFAEIV